MDRMSRIRRLRGGFTLFELMLVVAITALSVVLLGPDLQRWLQRIQLDSAAQTYLAAINRARSEAVTRRQPVSLCPRREIEAGVPRCGGDYRGGWLLFTDGGTDRQYDPASDELLAMGEPLPEHFLVGNNSGSRLSSETITYRSDGTAGRNLTQRLCTGSRKEIEPIAVILNTVGRARLERGEGPCPQL